MKVVMGRPPNYDRLVAEVGAEKVHRSFVCWGDTIYSPGGHDIPPDIEDHEKLHSEQQAAIGGPEVWWDRWFGDPAFRLDQEARGYGRQYAALRELIRRHGDQRRCLAEMAMFLSGPGYGNLTSTKHARSLILRYSSSPYS